MRCVTSTTASPTTALQDAGQDRPVVSSSTAFLMLSCSLSLPQILLTAEGQESKQATCFLFLCFNVHQLNNYLLVNCLVFYNPGKSMLHRLWPVASETSATRGAEQEADFHESMHGLTSGEGSDLHARLVSSPKAWSGCLGNRKQCNSGQDSRQMLGPRAAQAGDTYV